MWRGRQREQEGDRRQRREPCGGRRRRSRARAVDADGGRGLEEVVEAERKIPCYGNITMIGIIIILFVILITIICIWRIDWRGLEEVVEAERNIITCMHEFYFKYTRTFSCKYTKIVYV